jgi:hypothetical protein
LKHDQNLEIIAAIEATADAHGHVTPEGVVNAARDPASPLHDKFEWDDGVAAEQYRKEQARSLIRKLTFISVDKGQKVYPAIRYVHDPKEPEKQGYLSTLTLQDDRTRIQVMLRELGQCEALVKRTQTVAQSMAVERSFADLLSSIDEHKAYFIQLANPGI